VAAGAADSVPKTVADSHGLRRSPHGKPGEGEERDRAAATGCALEYSGLMPTQLTGSVTISGKVVDTAGAPIAGARCMSR